MEDDFDFISLAALTANVVRWMELGGAVVQAGAVETPSDEGHVDAKPSEE